MIEEVIVDAYGESEQVTGFYTMLHDNLAVPFKTVMLVHTRHKADEHQGSVSLQRAT